MTTRPTNNERKGSVRLDQSSFRVWMPGEDFCGRLRFDGLEIYEGVFNLRFWCPIRKVVASIKSDTHLLVRYSNESANFLEFDKLPVCNHRMWTSNASTLLDELSELSGGVFDNLPLQHYLFIFSNASIELACLGEPKIVVGPVK